MYRARGACRTESSLFLCPIYVGKGSGFHITIQPGQALLMTYTRKYRKIASCNGQRAHPVNTRSRRRNAISTWRGFLTRRLGARSACGDHRHPAPRQPICRTCISHLVLRVCALPPAAVWLWAAQQGCSHHDPAHERARHEADEHYTVCETTSAEKRCSSGETAVMKGSTSLWAGHPVLESVRYLTMYTLDSQNRSMVRTLPLSLRAQAAVSKSASTRGRRASSMQHRR